MNNKQQRNRLFTMLMLVMAMLAPQWAWAQKQPDVGTGTSADPFVITSAEELAWFRDYVNEAASKQGDEKTIRLSACAKLQPADGVIDMSSVCGEADGNSWVPISNGDGSWWYGTFDGQGCTISNLYVSNQSLYHVGLFGDVNFSEEGKDCKITNIRFSKAKVSGANWAGILCGRLRQCKVSQIITDDDCVVSSSGSVGGIVGNAGNNTSIAECYNAATVSGTSDFGGICGYTSGECSLSRCANHGLVKGTSNSGGGIVGSVDNGIAITGCANYASVEGKDKIGGIAGFATNGTTITDCANYASVEGQAQVGGIIGMGNNTLCNVLSCGNVTSTGFGGLLVGYGNVAATGVVAYNSEATPSDLFGYGSLTSGSATGYTAGLLKTGMVAYLLNGSRTGDQAAWGQNLAEDGDAFPVVGSAYRVYPEGKVTLNCTTNELEGAFSNTPTTDGTFGVGHGTAVHHAAQAATCTQDGSLEYWQCSLCDKTFDDEEMTHEVGSTVVPATGHDYDDNDRCTKCNKEIQVVTLGDNAISIEKVFGDFGTIGGYNLYKYTATENGKLEVTIVCSSTINGTLWKSRSDESPLKMENLGFNTSRLAYDVEQGVTYYIGARTFPGDAFDGDLTLNIRLNGFDCALPEGMTGQGTETNPIVLRTAEHLAWLRDYINKGNHSICAKIADDVDGIDMSGVCHAATSEDADDELSWKPIGSADVPYGGTFDGNGKTISNLYVNTGEQYAALFGCTEGATIRNITFDNAHVVSTGDYNTGILVGSSVLSTVQNIKTLSNCSVTGKQYTGGIAGSVANMSNCENHATVNGTDDVGGIVGILSGENSLIASCANYGKITGENRDVGGMAGYCSLGAIQDCANYGEISGADRVGGMIGSTDSGSLKNALCYGGVNNGGLVIGEIYREIIADGIIACNSEASENGASGAVKPVGSGSLSFAEGKTEADVVKAFAKAQLASGEVAYLLNGSTSTPAEGETLSWYQKLGDNADAYPVLKSTGDNTVYATYLHGQKESIFANEVSANVHTKAYNAETKDEADGNHDVSYEAEYAWTESEDKTEVPSVAATFTCKVCGNTVTPEMTVVRDEAHDNTAATCTEDGHSYYKTTYAFNDMAVFSDTHTLIQPALGHDMSDEVVFDSAKSIYMKGCTRGCGHNEYFATSDASVKAEPNGDATAFTVNELSLDDATAYDNKAAFTVTDLAYTRTFSHDKWQAVYVPFAFDCSQLDEDLEVAAINNFHEYEQTDGTYNVVLEVKRVTKGGTIPALTPCLIRMKQTPDAAGQARTLHFADASFAPAAAKSIDCSSVTRYYQFTGTLEGKAAFNGDGSEFVLNNGELWWAKSNTQLKPQRWYLTAIDRNADGVQAAQLTRIAIRVIGDGYATGIEDIHIVTDGNGAAGNRQGIYDLQGRKLDKEPASGIYIKNGKKCVK